MPVISSNPVYINTVLERTPREPILQNPEKPKKNYKKAVGAVVCAAGASALAAVTFYAIKKAMLPFEVKIKSKIDKACREFLEHNAVRKSNIARMEEFTNQEFADNLNRLKNNAPNNEVLKKNVSNIYKNAISALEQEEKNTGRLGGQYINKLLLKFQDEPEKREIVKSLLGDFREAINKEKLEVREIAKRQIACLTVNKKQDIDYVKRFLENNSKNST